MPNVGSNDEFQFARGRCNGILVPGIRYICIVGLHALYKSSEKSRKVCKITSMPTCIRCIYIAIA